MAVEPGYALRAGRILAGMHYKIVPIGVGQKYPPIQAWQEAATDDLDQVAAWLAETNYGIGWAMGLQPNGKHLFCLDIDGDAGVEALVGLLHEHGGQEAFELTCQQQTGSGGWHYIFESEVEVRNSARQFAPGVDVRGEGGQIVVGPTIHPNGQAYRWVKGPKRNPPQLAPAWVLERILTPTQAPSLATVPVSPTAVQVNTLINGFAHDDEPPFEYIKRTFDSYAAVQRLGWQPGQRRGDEEKMTRPGKDPRHGTSAVFHHDTGALVVFSTSVDPAYGSLGKPGQGCISLTRLDIWMVENGVSDESEAARLIRQLMPQQPGATASSSPGLPVQVDDTRQGVPSDANLPDEFWASREWLSHIRDAAHSRGASADAILGALFTRFAAAVPPSYSIPAIVMAPSTFDHMSVLVAKSSGGKSGAMSIARELFPGPQYDTIVWDFPNPTGEGLVDAFFEMVQEDDGEGKKRLINKKVRDAVHFSIDEAMALVEAGANRKGATIGSVLCTAWSGGNPGQGNASADRRRVGMNPGTFRVSGLAAIQLGLGHHLLSDTWVQQGLSGRLVFFAAEDPTIPHWSQAPQWPGPLDIITPPKAPVIMEYASEIIEEVRQAHWEKQTGQVHEAPIDGHLRLVRLKLAGLFALIEGRRAVTVADWRLTGFVVHSHLTMRNRMLEARRQQQSDESHRAAEARGHSEYVAETAKERRIIHDLSLRIIARATPEGAPLGKMRAALLKGPTRIRWEPALEAAIASGKIVVRDNKAFEA